MPRRNSGSVLQDWVMALPLRLQGVLVSAVRGCDTAKRHDHSKVLQRVYRAEILVTPVGDPAKCASFMLWADAATTVKMMQEFLDDCDHLPNHYVMHFIHAASIVGYYHEDLERRDLWKSFYTAACKKFHLRPEPLGDLYGRLTQPEEEFGKAQNVVIETTAHKESVRRLAKAEDEKHFGGFGGGS